MNRKIVALLVVGMLLMLVGCAKKAMPEAVPEPPAPAPEVQNEVVDELGSLDSVTEDLDIEGFDSLDTELADIEDLDI